MKNNLPKARDDVKDAGGAEMAEEQPNEMNE